MAEPTSLPTTDPISAEPTYKPLSIWALVGLLIAMLFAVLVIANVIAGLADGVPFALGNTFLLIPLLGAAATLAALWEINQSEGTRAGKGLAKWGLWINVLLGLGYFAYSMATFFAIRQQANAFLLDPDTGFFSRLKQPDGVNLAFLLTRPAEYRGNLSSARDNAEIESRFDKWEGSGRPGPLSVTTFRNHFLVRALHQGGPQAEVEIQGVRESDYQKGGYWVTFLLEARNKELTFTTPITVRSLDSSAGEREWYVDWTQMSGRPTNLTFTKFGSQMMSLRNHSHEFAQGWIKKLIEGEIDQVRAAARQKDFFTTDQITGKANRKMLDDFMTRLVTLKPDDPHRPKVDLSRLEQMWFTCCKIETSAEVMRPLAYWQIDLKTGRLRITHEVMVPIEDDPEHNDRPRVPGHAQIVCPARLIVERTDAKDLKYDADRPQTWYDAEHPPKWSVVRLEIYRVERMNSKPPGQRGRPPS